MQIELIILFLVFVAVLLVAFVIINFFFSRRDVSRRVERAGQVRRSREDRVDQILANENESIRYYLDVVQNDSPNSLRMRLVQAGYFSKDALRTFNMIRFAASVGSVFLVFYAISILSPDVGGFVSLILGLFMAGVVFILASAVLERKAKKRQREFRKIFPDFMDLLLVCIDAGLGINSAIDRVTREFLVTTPDFGVQLSIVALETRAGRPLDQALLNFSKRIDVEEARALAILFKQSQELGASMSHTLRVFSAEMREQRLLRAEEKANALPVKMLLPMAGFMFPVNLIIVLVPIMIAILGLMTQLSPQ